MKKMEMKCKVKEAAPAGGATMRHLLLAYGLLRGIPYDRMERTNREHNEPRVELIVKSMAPFLDEGDVWTNERVRACLARGA
jgi:hypothetical protein